MEELVFVYGSLLWSEENNRYLRDARRISALAWTQGRLIDTGLGYPAMLREEETGTVNGELYSMTAETLREIDEFEDFYGFGHLDNEYERVKLEVWTDKGKFQAWAYIFNRETGLAAVHGDWRLSQMQRTGNVLYFAYGSCMDTERISQAGWHDHFKMVVGRGVAEGFSLKFTYVMEDGGRADLVECGGRTEGKLYRISAECLQQYLYLREGVDSNQYRPAVIPVRLDNGDSVPAVTFIVVDKQSEIAPPAHYMKEILRGARPVVSAEYHEALLTRFVTSYGYVESSF
ncbi:gamma-glutamylcyclotransferase [Paenibacillus sp. sgz500958]|uniref:gamma-glutamylcyclotransferase n=1 Tax=Paenibacillus sp. sgz500958 TaxID=3242475 RepID=UPI0036D29593